MGWISNLFGGKKDGSGAEGKKPSKEQVESGAEDDGQRKGYVETKQGKFGRKKVIETNLGPDGKPVYTGYQLEQAMERMKSRKMAREQAKKEEKAYVEYRKAEILRTFQPKVGTLRLGDEAYPKRRRVGMGFGERKAHFLAIRPKPKYATWIGRKKGIIEAKAQPKTNATAAVVTDHSMLPDHSIRATHSTKHDDKDDQSRKEKTEKTEMDKQAAGKEGGEKKAIEESKKDEKVKKEKEQKKREIRYVKDNARFSNPLKPDGTPFWCGEAQEEMSDEDLPVDMDVLEKVCNGEKVLATKPYTKMEFSPYGPIVAMKADDVLFVRDTILFANTVESVISLQPEEDTKNKKLPPPVQNKLKWSDQVRVKMYHPALRVPHKQDTSWQEQFHMVNRDNNGKKGA